MRYSQLQLRNSIGTLERCYLAIFVCAFTEPISFEEKLSRLKRYVRMPSGAWAYRKEKIRGAETNLPDFFGFCPTSAKKFFAEKINFDDLPPPVAKKISVCVPF